MAPQTSPVTKTDDGRYVVVNGRRWRASDPSIPDALRTELVSELMAGRRAVKSADSEVATAEARRRVHDAKVALGERGAAWWEPSDDSVRRTRTVAAIRTMLRKRAIGATVCPSDIARIVGGEGWRDTMDHVRDVAAELSAAGHVEILQRGKVVPAGSPITGPVRIGRGADFDGEP